MYRMLAAVAAMMLMLTGCSSVDLEGASYAVSYTDAGVDGLRSSSNYSIDGSDMAVARTDYLADTSDELSLQLSDSERDRVDELVQAVLREDESDYLCADTPSANIQVRLANGDTESRFAHFCGQEELPLRDLVDYLNSLAG